MTDPTHPLYDCSSDSGSGRAWSFPFRYGRYSLHLVPESPLPLPRFSGSLFRGAFGWALQHVLCVTRTYECPSCFLNSRCLFPQVFDTAPFAGSTVMRKYRTVPHPFVLDPPGPDRQTLPSHRPFELGLTVFGKVTVALPYLLFAMERMGQQGLGRQRIRCRVTRVEAHYQGTRWLLYVPEDRCPKPAHGFVEEMPVRLSLENGSPQREERITVTFLTPARIRYGGALAETLPFHVLVRQLLRRVALLSYFHCDGPGAGFPFRAFIALAERVRTVRSDLTWFDWERYSTRQQSRMALGGLLGTVTYEGPLTPFGPLLQAGEICHVGKGTSFGLGRFRVSPS